MEHSLGLLELLDLLVEGDNLLLSLVLIQGHPLLQFLKGLVLHFEFCYLLQLFLVFALKFRDQSLILLFEVFCVRALNL